jgi:hypothetical protein
MVSIDARGRAARRVMRAYTSGLRKQEFETRAEQLCAARTGSDLDAV